MGLARQRQHHLVPEPHRWLPSTLPSPRAKAFSNQAPWWCPAPIPPLTFPAGALGSTGLGLSLWDRHRSVWACVCMPRCWKLEQAQHFRTNSLTCSKMCFFISASCLLWLGGGKTHTAAVQTEHTSLAPSLGVTQKPWMHLAARNPSLPRPGHHSACCLKKENPEVLQSLGIWLRLFLQDL